MHRSNDGVAAAEAPAPDGGMRSAMVKLSRALGHPKVVDATDGQCVEAALIELAAARIAGVPAPQPSSAFPTPEETRARMDEAMKRARGVDLVDLPQQHEAPEKWVSKADMERAHGVGATHHQGPAPSDADASKDRP